MHGLKLCLTLNLLQERINMTFEDVRCNIIKGVYTHESDLTLIRSKLPYSHVIDEQQSVAWNRAKVEDLNKELDKQIEVIRTNNRKKTAQFRADIIECASKEYEFNIHQCELIYDKIMDCTEYDYICQEFVKHFISGCEFVYQVCHA